MSSSRWRHRKPSCLLSLIMLMKSLVKLLRADVPDFQAGVQGLRVVLLEPMPNVSKVYLEVQPGAAEVTLMST